MDNTMRQYYQSLQNAVIGAALTESRQPEIRSQIDAMNREVGQISAFVANIEDRFQSVLQPEVPSNEACAGAPPYCTELGGEIGALTERLASARRRLARILDRAEL
ncbi:hypothetical protein HTY52_22800 [Cupriavidus taiwanensis]|uniref:hypothetical protein n=1 Tax=Cupriavidus taiwanensis TaxID=164546 RepID=UPI001573225B|nr:hypothetical protein [Cupriavidus taiwanensis]NSX16925.1 hypothetical protein [Cupriavidus taiwanensis]